MEESFVVELKSEVLRKVDKMPLWRTRILFGSLKRYRHYFWTYEEMRKINEEYHQALMNHNRFPIEYISFFRSKDEGVIINSFFSDCRDPEDLKMVIWDIKYNLEHLSHIIDLCLEYEI